MKSRTPDPGSSDQLARLTVQVGTLVQELTGLVDVNPDAELAELGVDSLAKLDLLAALEQRFGIALSEDLAREFRSVSRIARLVHDALRYGLQT
jgi:acyl carrier protein